MRKARKRRQWLVPFLAVSAIAMVPVLFMCLEFAAARGTQALRNWNARYPLPEGGLRTVRRLEEYRSEHGRYPPVLSKIGPLEGLDESRVKYLLFDGADAKEFLLTVGVDPNGNECEFDRRWTYKSREERWNYISIYHAGDAPFSD